MVFIDNYNAGFRGMIMCHMMADTEEELDAMAEAVGLRREWKQVHPKRRPHYDICKAKKAKALALGAQEITCHEMVRRFSILRPNAGNN